MATINLRELRRRLPHGSIVRIAEATGISAKVIGEVLNKGWHVELRGRVCDAALSILDESKIEPDVIKHAQELGVASAHSIYVPQRSRRKPVVYEEPEEDDLTWDDLCEMDFDELADLCEEWDLETDPDDEEFQPSFLTTAQGREDDLREAIAEELGIEIGDDKDYDDEDEDE